MNKNDLIDKIATRSQATKADVGRMLNAFIDTITDALSEGDTITMVGFGTFKVSDRKARSGRNPQTGQAITIPAQTTARFTAGKQLKDAVNQKKK